jgi:hypothetical protein
MGYEKKKKRKQGVKSPLAYNEQDWEAERDAQALARADAVRSDPTRMKRAQEWAAKQLEESKAKKAEAEKMIELGNAA